MGHYAPECKKGKSEKALITKGEDWADTSDSDEDVSYTLMATVEDKSETYENKLGAFNKFSLDMWLLSWHLTLSLASGMSSFIYTNFLFCPKVLVCRMSDSGSVTMEVAHSASCCSATEEILQLSDAILESTVVDLADENTLSSESRTSGCRIVFLVSESKKGFAVGNGNTDPASQYKAYTDFALDNKLIAITDYQRINKKIPECEKDIKLCATKGNNSCLHAYKACRGIYDSILDITGNINDCDIRKECKGAHCYDFSRMDTFLNLPSVKEALGVHTDFISCSDTVKSAMSTYRMKDLEVGIPELLEDGIKELGGHWMCKSQKSNPRKEFDVVR
ncbi:hypothetical protein POM88_044663 [Heracleum sosnowskyi]|uniref:Uncharacterized protein n=1 Tax=Heracleum sosnowskyi TaxID=360622 RepID=A0AAD8H4B0_9APIA|nr:hypothetical protein POM88_044663 [Heracleum sosnowskyi]